jgi:hypothetical protein
VTDESGRGFWIGLALGTPFVLYGAIELVHRAGWPRAIAAGQWLAVGLLLHDFVLVPLVLAVVWLVGRAAPPWLRTPLRAGVLGSVLVLALGWPGLRGYGNKPDNATIHPLDYTAAVVTVLATMWIALTLWATWRGIRSRAMRSRGAGSHAAAPRSPRTSRTPVPE